MSSFGSENKHFNPLKITAEVFFFYSPSPMNIKPLFLEKKEQIKHRIFSFLNFMLVAMVGWSVFGAALMLVFLSEKNCIRQKKKKMPLRFNYLSILFFTTKTLTLLLCCSIEKKIFSRCIFFSNGKGSITSKMDCLPFLSLTKGAECFE